jgi:hypothetical protein
MPQVKGHWIHYVNGFEILSDLRKPILRCKYRRYKNCGRSRYAVAVDKKKVGVYCEKHYKVLVENLDKQDPETEDEL